MPVTDVQKDFDALTMTITAELDAGADRVWRLWADPRQLERWWGPPSHTTSFTEHELRPGGGAAYVMTGPDGGRFEGRWRFEEVEEPRRLLLVDAVVDDDRPSDGGPAAMTVTLSESDGRTTMAIESRFADRESLEKTLEMGFEQGMREVVDQADALLA